MTEPPTNPPPYPQFPPPQQPVPAYPYPPQPGTNGFAIASLVFGLIGGCFLGIAFGIVALTKIKKTGQKGRGMAIAGLVLSALWIVGLGIAVAIGLSLGAERNASGELVDGGMIQVDNLRVGDCANDLEGEGDVFIVDAVPCAEPHTGEVIDLVTVNGETFPGDDALEEQAEEDCVDALEDTSERAFEDESYSIYWIQPSQETWADDDRTIVCMVTTDDARSGSVTD